MPKTKFLKEILVLILFNAQSFAQTESSTQKMLPGETLDVAITCPKGETGHLVVGSGPHISQSPFGELPIFDFRGKQSITAKCDAMICDLTQGRKHEFVVNVWVAGSFGYTAGIYTSKEEAFNSLEKFLDEGKCRFVGSNSANNSEKFRKMVKEKFSNRFIPDSY